MPKIKIRLLGEWFLNTVRLFCPKPRLTIISMFYFTYNSKCLLSGGIRWAASGLGKTTTRTQIGSAFGWHFHFIHMLPVLQNYSWRLRNLILPWHERGVRRDTIYWILCQPLAFTGMLQFSSQFYHLPLGRRKIQKSLVSNLFVSKGRQSKE